MFDAIGNAEITGVEENPARIKLMHNIEFELVPNQHANGHLIEDVDDVIEILDKGDITIKKIN